MSKLDYQSRNVLVSVVVPTKNEELTIEKFITWVQIGFKSCGVPGELILLDNSDDSTPVIASKLGAIVHRPSSLGLGAAYKEAVDLIRGKYVILGDADCTYDFRDISGFINALKESDFVMGNRFGGGGIERGSMPIHHRYFGSPLTSWILRSVHQLNISDVHCGMRAMTSDLYRNLPFSEPGWEYAPEMVIRACQAANSYQQIPIRFLKAPKGRVSHFKRGPKSWLKPFQAGIGAIRVTLTLGLNRVTETVGKWLFFISTALVVLISTGPIQFFEITFSTVTQVLFAMLGLTGNLMNSVGIHLKEFYAVEKGALRLQDFIQLLDRRFQRLFVFITTFLSLAFLIMSLIVVGVSQNKNDFGHYMYEFQGVFILLIYILSLLFHRFLINIMSKYLAQT